MTVSFYCFCDSSGFRGEATQIEIDSIATVPSCRSLRGSLGLGIEKFSLFFQYVTTSMAVWHQP
jgi:hypothetical protein